MKKSLSTFVMLLCIAIFSSAMAQLRTPAPSPKATFTQAVGVTDFSAEYSRPSVKGRKIFGELVPYGKVWRTGANEATKISFSTDVNFQGQTIPAGKYSLYTIPEQNEWTVIFSKKLENWGSDGYKQDQDALRVKVKPTELSNKVETFTILIGDITEKGANLDLMWDNVKVSVPFTVEVDKYVMESIDKAVTNIKPDDWQTYAQAGTYLYQTNKDIDKAAEYLQKSVSIKPQFWTLNTQSLIQARQGNYTAALATANKALEKAKEAKNEFYINQIEMNIRAWQEKVPAKGKGKKKR